MIRDCGSTILSLHHRKKPPSPRPGEPVVIPSIEDDHNSRLCFAQARGAGTVVNGTDVRIAVDIPGTSGTARSESLFGGSGSTLIACERRGRNARLMELDPRYTDVILKRWEEFAGKVAKLAPSECTFEQTRQKRRIEPTA